MSEFEESNKVVCVNDSSEGVFGVKASVLRFPGGSVVKGGTYCVERVYPGENGTQGLILTEPKIYLRDGTEIGFNSTRFLKVHPKETVAARDEQFADPARPAPGEVEAPPAPLRGGRQVVRCFASARDATEPAAR